MRRGGIHACGDQLFLLVSSDPMLEALPTAWGLLVATSDPQTAPPLVIRVPRCLDRGTRDGWVRMSQIRTLAVAAVDVEPAGRVPAEAMVDIDRTLAQLISLD